VFEILPGLLRFAAPLAVVLAVACAPAPQADPRPDGGCPFYGPVERIDGVPKRPVAFPAPEPPAVIEEVVRRAGEAAPAAGPAGKRRAAWLEGPFRCRAISTTRLRTCRFALGDGATAITFPVADLTCRETIFDGNGDPQELRGCASRWIRVPSIIRLKRGAHDLWSGSHSGWRWGDGEAYCCPGVWIEAPAALRGGGS
jgi:hypothetical protein